MNPHISRLRRAVPLLCMVTLLIGSITCNLPAGSETPAPPEDETTPPVAPTPSAVEAQPAANGEQPPTATVEEQPTDTQPTTTQEPAPPAAPTDLNVPLQVHNPFAHPRIDEPVTSGVPLPQSLELTDVTQLRLVDAEGNPVPAQFTPLARWGGASDDTSSPIRWVLVDFQATVGPQETAYYFLQQGGPGPMHPHALVVDDGTDSLTIDVGVAQFSISKIDGGLSAPGLAAPLYGRARAGSGEYTTAGPVVVSVAQSGPMRVSIQVQGAYRSASGTTLMDYTSRYWFYAGQPSVRLFHTVENNTLCPLVEYGQLDCYDIDSGGGVTVSDLSLALSTDLGGGLTYQAAGAGTPVSGELTADLLLYQDSSGSDHWEHYAAMTDWDGAPLDTRPRMQSYVGFRGYRTTSGGTTVDSGDQAAGWLRIAGDTGAWTVGVRDFWQNFPKALRAFPNGALEIGLFPEEFGPHDYAFTLRAGEHKTHEIFLSFDSPLPPGGEGPGVRGTTPLFAAAPSAWYIDSGALGITAPRNWTDWPDHEDYINYQLDTAPTYEDWMDWFPNLPAAIGGTDFYGIFDYGDWPLDYEGYWVAPFNHKYDSDYGMWLQWARGGDPRWFSLAEAADRHFADVDILHNLHSPRHWGDGIAFGHSYHDEDGFLNPHRNYGGNHPDTAFGMRGLLLAYYLTGYEKAYASALELADSIEYRLHNEFQLCAYFDDCSGEGYALGEGLYDAGSRPAANNLSIAVAAYRATADPRYLTVADALVDWARAENQPYIDGPNGEDQMMRPWMLNMYLRALVDYIEMRDEFDLPDDYDAKGSFLAYADWLRTYALVELDPIDTGPRAAYPYEWWFDDRQGDPNDEWAVGNNVVFTNNWLLLGADALAYAHHLSGEADYLEEATRLFRTGTRDPFFEGDANTYSAAKETVNSITFGHIFLYEWEAR